MSIWDESTRSGPNEIAEEPTSPSSGEIVFDLSRAFEERLEPLLDEITAERAESNRFHFVRREDRESDRIPTMIRWRCGWPTGIW